MSDALSGGVFGSATDDLTDLRNLVDEIGSSSFEARFGIRLIEVYGSTELGVATAPRGDLRKRGTMGLPCGHLNIEVHDGNDDAVPHVAASIRRFGWQQPIVARPSGEVVAGNTRLKAAQELGMTEVPVWWFEGDDLAATGYQIADNNRRALAFVRWAAGLDRKPSPTS